MGLPAGFTHTELLWAVPGPLFAISAGQLGAYELRPWGMQRPCLEHLQATEAIAAGSQHALRRLSHSAASMSLWLVNALLNQVHEVA